MLRRPVESAQYVSIKYTERLAEAGIEPSVGSVGDSYDNALAETINGLYKAEVIHRRGPWRSFEAVEYATLEWVDWFNHRRLLEPSAMSHLPKPKIILCCRGQHRYGSMTHNLRPPADPARFKGYSESLDHEVRGLGIRVVLIEPAYTKSSFEQSMAAPTSHCPYISQLAQPPYKWSRTA